VKKNLYEIFVNKLNVVGLITPLSEPSIIELAATANFDFVILDSEHGQQAPYSCESAILASKYLNIPFLIRIDRNSISKIPHYLDMDFDGIVVPHVTCKEDLIEIIKAIYYHPIGERGIGSCRANKYAVNIEMDKYIKEANELTSLLIQIEDEKALKYLEEILDEKRVNGVLIGLRDLSTSLGCPGKYKDPSVINAVLDIITHCNKKEIPVIIPVSKVSDALEYTKAGANGFLISFYSLVYDVFKSKVDDIRCSCLRYSTLNK
jgi:4-hydroxy-2-oxoheptanedioate aldolase